MLAQQAVAYKEVTIEPCAALGPTTDADSARLEVGEEAVLVQHKVSAFPRCRSGLVHRTQSTDCEKPQVALGDHALG